MFQYGHQATTDRRNGASCCHDVSTAFSTVENRFEAT